MNGEVKTGSVTPRRGTVAVLDATLRLEGAVKEATELCQHRLKLLSMVVLAAFVAVSARLVDVMWEYDTESAKSGNQRAASAANTRGDIVDRNGVLLATSVGTISVVADPREVRDVSSPEEVADKLVSVMPDLDREKIVKNLHYDRSFVWIKRQIDPLTRERIRKLWLSGIYFQSEEKRVWPQKNLTSHVVGFTDIDRNGIAGIERQFDSRLAASSDSDSEDIQLTIDVRVQHIVHEEISNAIRHFGAIGGSGVVLDVHTGEVLAMVSLPDFEPGKAGSASADQRFNRVTFGTYELGSVIKTLTGAIGLDSGVVTLASGYDVSKPLKMGRYTIKDYRGEERILTIPEVLVFSSNIAAAKLALDVGGERQQSYLRQLGLLDKSEIELPEVGTPNYPDKWSDLSTATIGFGHGIAVTPLQAASSLAAILNGGTRVKPTLIVREDREARKGERVISHETSQTMRLLTHLVVEYGSGRKSRVDGYLLGGKTGTAEKVGRSGRYEKGRLLTSYFAAFPIDDPQFLILVSLDEPKGTKETHGFATAGWNAAPTVGRIVARLGPLAGVYPKKEHLAGLSSSTDELEDQLEYIGATF